LPECHPAYALTVHKAQGSQANRVILVLPETDSKVLSRELVYTGLTRARESVEIWSSLDVFSAAVSRSAARPTGLMERF
jgi:exodeoxyribonuclease V alpha subunit